MLNYQRRVASAKLRGIEIVQRDTEANLRDHREALGLLEKNLQDLRSLEAEELKKLIEVMHACRREKEQVDILRGKISGLIDALGTMDGLSAHTECPPEFQCSDEESASDAFERRADEEEETESELEVEYAVAESA